MTDLLSFIAVVLLVVMSASVWGRLTLMLFAILAIAFGALTAVSSQLARSGDERLRWLMTKARRVVRR